MNPLSALYGAIVGVRNGFYDRGTLAVRRLRGPVVSVGNITVGGAGKTPFLMMLGELLKRRGVSFDVLSRGYGRITTGVALVDPDGSPRDFGDEPLLIARKLDVPVVVGEDRHAAGQFAEQRFGAQLHLLDDGFQHRRLARDFDIVLITPSDAGDSLLPVGRLREPLSSLARADAIVVVNDDSSQALPIREQTVWRVRRATVLPAMQGPCVAFCGIAKPDNFFQELRSAGLMLPATRSFRDHHFYSDEDVRQLLELRKKHGAAGFITTEKDIINLGRHVSDLAPVSIATVQMQFEDTDAAMTVLLSSIAAHNRQ